jgi:hypothetical protein
VPSPRCAFCAGPPPGSVAVRIRLVRSRRVDADVARLLR